MVWVLCICGLPGEGSGPVWLVSHSSTPHRENPHWSRFQSESRKRGWVCFWALGLVYRRGSSRVTSHQTLGPLKHIWVAPAVPGVYQNLNRAQRTGATKKRVRSQQSFVFQEHVFLVKGEKFGLFKNVCLKEAQEREVIIPNDRLTEKSKDLASVSFWVLVQSHY